MCVCMCACRVVLCSQERTQTKRFYVLSSHNYTLSLTYLSNKYKVENSACVRVRVRVRVRVVITHLVHTAHLSGVLAL